MTAPGDAESSSDKRLGIDLFNGTWELMEKSDRTPADDALMIHKAHASVYHWSLAPEHEPKHLAVGEWQVARALSLLGQGQSALYHARRSLEICATNGIGDYVLAYAHEAIARAAAALDDRQLFTLHYNIALQSVPTLADEDDRELLIKDLRSGPWFGMSGS